MAVDPPFPERQHVLEPGCARCPALVESREQIAWGTGDPDAAVFAVGEAPAAGDPAAERWQGGNHTGRAFTSRHSGHKLRGLLADIGQPDAYVTNAVKCFPAAADDPTTNREPSPAERRRCQEHLRTELASVDPSVILGVGRTGTEALLAIGDRELEDFLETVGTRLSVSGLPGPVLPLLHPSYEAVWLGELGLDRDAYRSRIEGAVTEALEGA